MAALVAADGGMAAVGGMAALAPFGGIKILGHREYVPAFKTYCRAPLAGKLLAVELG